MVFREARFWRRPVFITQHLGSSGCWCVIDAVAPYITIGRNTARIPYFALAPTRPNTCAVPSDNFGGVGFFMGGLAVNTTRRVAHPINRRANTQPAVLLRIISALALLDN